MKKILYITLIIISSFSFSLNAQINYLTDIEYSNIKFDGVSIMDISSSKGTISIMQNLFNNDLTVEQGYSEAVEFWIDFSTNSLSVKFYNGIQENSEITYDLASIEILNNSSKLFIKEKVIKIGDSQSMLSGLNSRIVNNQKIFTFSANNIDEYVFIYVDILSGKIIKIGYDGNLL